MRENGYDRPVIYHDSLAMSVDSSILLQSRDDPTVAAEVYHAFPVHRSLSGGPQVAQEVEVSPQHLISTPESLEAKVADQERSQAGRIAHLPPLNSDETPGPLRLDLDAGGFHPVE